MGNIGKRPRTLSPKQLRAIELRVQGMDLSAIADEIGQHRTTVSRWFNQDNLVIAELAKGVQIAHEEELRRHAGIRQKAPAPMRE